MSLILIGASGFGCEVLWSCRRAGLAVAGFCDDASDKQSGLCGGLPLLGSIEQAARTLGPGTRAHIAVGNNVARQKLAARVAACGWMPVSVVDPAALISSDADVGDGAFAGPYAVISTRVHIGRFVLVNQHVTVGHDAHVGDFSQLCPGARLSGNVVLGEGALMGSNAVLLPGRKMGKWSVLGAGAIGVTDIADGNSIVRAR